jgi:hypothetical protein
VTHADHDVDGGCPAGAREHVHGHARANDGRTRLRAREGAQAAGNERRRHRPTLGLTTPDVQACLADVVEEPQMANPPSKLPLAPQRPVADGPIRRAPDGQNE